MALFVLRIAWRRWTLLFVLLEAGTVSVTAGHALAGRSFAAWFNAGWVVGFACIWVAVNRVRQRRESSTT